MEITRRKAVKARPKTVEDLKHIGTHLPEVRKRILLTIDDNESSLGADIIWHCGMRPGSEISLRKFARYGVSTITPEHFHDDFRRIEFIGKKGVLNKCDLAEHHRVRVERLCNNTAHDEAILGRNSASRINQVLYPLKTQDLRIWRANSTAAEHLMRFTPVKNTIKERKAAVKNAVKHASHSIQNTPGACKSSYLVKELLNEFLNDPETFKMNPTVSALLSCRAGSTHDCSN